MTYTPTLVFHIAGGIVGFIAGTAALIFRKGSRGHRGWGDVFVIAMTCMSIAGGYIAVAKMERTNILAASITLYLVLSALLTVRDRATQTGFTSRALTIVPIASFLASIYWAVTRHAMATYLIFATIAFLFVIADVRMFLAGGLQGPRRLARHLWRMGVALFIATASFFLGVSSDPVMRVVGLRARLFTPAVRATYLPFVPVLFVVGTTLYWLVKTRRGMKREVAA